MNSWRRWQDKKAIYTWYIYICFALLVKPLVEVLCRSLRDVGEVSLRRQVRYFLSPALCSRFKKGPSKCSSPFPHHIPTRRVSRAFRGNTIALAHPDQPYMQKLGKIGQYRFQEFGKKAKSLAPCTSPTISYRPSVSETRPSEFKCWFG